MADYDAPQQPYRKRPRFSHNQQHQYQEFTIEERIAKLGETGSKNEEIGKLAADISSDLMNKGQDEKAAGALTSKICRCVVSFPTRIGAYATLIGLISVKHYNIACQIINTLHASYPVYLEAQKWNEALTIIHLLSSLVNCKVIRLSALLSQYEFLLETTLEDNCPQARSDYFVYTVMSSLPYVAFEIAQEKAKELAEENAKKLAKQEAKEPAEEETKESTEDKPLDLFDKILETIETYLNKRSKDHLNVIRVWTTSDSTVQMDYLDSLWIQIKNFRANNWIENFLHRPYNHTDNKHIMASSLIPTNSPTFQIPGHNNKCFYPAPRIVFRIFEDDVSDGAPNMPGIDKIERFCIENHIRAIIDELYDQPYNCARHLAHMYNSDHLPMKHLLIETILGELFTLPKPKHPEILYQTLLFNFTKIYFMSRQPNDIKNNYDFILNEAVKVLFDNLGTMNVTCFTRFVNWFSFHLNNTEFIYPWKSWTDAESLDRASFKSVFVQDVLERCVRFSFHKKISTVLNGDLIDLMPEEVKVEYRPVLKDNPKAQQVEATVKNLILEKADGKRICEELNIIIEGVELPDDFALKDEKPHDQLLKIDIFTAFLLSIAAKSLTHLSSAIGKYRNVFKALTRSPNGQIQLLQTIHSCLEKHPQLQTILVDKLLKAELVEAKQVVEWIFSNSMKPYHVKSYTWELLNITISRSRQIIDKLETEKSDLKDDDQEAEAAAAESNRPSTPTAEEDTNGNKVSNNGDVEMKVDEATRKLDVKKETEALQDKILIATNDMKRLLLHVFKLFSVLLANHIQECESSSVSYMNDHYRWLTGRMQEVYYNNIDLIREDVYEQVRTIVDSVPSIGNSIINLNQ